MQKQKKKHFIKSFLATLLATTLVLPSTLFAASSYQRVTATQNGDTKTYDVPAGSGTTISIPTVGTLTDNGEAQQIVTNADFFKIGSPTIHVWLQLNMDRTMEINRPVYNCYYELNGSTQVVGGSNPAEFNYYFEPLGTGGSANFDIDVVLNGVIPTLFTQEMYTVNGVWSLYDGATVLGNSLDYPYNQIKEIYDHEGEKFNWGQNSGFLSGVANNGQGWNDSVQSMKTVLEYSTKHAEILGDTLVCDVQKKKYAVKMRVHIGPEDFQQMDFRTQYRYVLETRDKIQERLISEGALLEAEINDKSVMLGIPSDYVRPLLAVPGCYRQMDSTFTAWSNYWKEFLGNKGEDFMWQLWCAEGDPFGDGSHFNSSNIEFLQNNKVESKIYCPYLIQFLPTEQLLNLKILDPKKPVPYVDKYTSCIYDPTDQTIKIHPYGMYEEGPTEKEDALIRVTLTSTNPGVIEGADSENKLQFETPKMTLPNKEVVDYGDLTPIQVHPHPTRDEEVTVKLYLNPPQPEGSETHEVVETKNPPLYEDNVIEFKITIPAGNKSNNLTAVSLSNFKSNEGSCSVTAKYLYTNVLKKNMPGDDKKTDFTLEVFYNNPPTDQNTSHDPSKLDSATSSNGQVPIELDTIGSKTHKIRFNIDPDYEGYISLHYRVNPSWDKPKEETNLEDNDVWLVVRVTKDPDPPEPGEPNLHEMKYNDRVSAEEMNADAFQPSNTQDLKHDGVPHKDTGSVQVTPCIPMSDTGWYKSVEAGKFTAYQCLSNWSEKPWENPMPNVVPPNYCWGELTGDPYTVDIIEYCPCAVGGDEDTPGACPWCGKPCYAYAYKQTLLSCGLPYPTPPGAYDNRFISFVFATDKLLQNGDTSIWNNPNVTQWTTKSGNFCHEETYYETETDSEGNEHTVEKKKRIYTTWFKRANDYQWLTYRIRRNESSFDFNAFDYKTKSQQSKAGYGFGVDAESGYNTDYIEVFQPLKVASFIQFPYFSNYREGPWEVTWLNLKNFNSGTSVADITRASFEMPLNIKDYSKQPIGYRYSILNAPEKFTHVNLPNGNLSIFNSSFVATKLDEAWEGGRRLEAGSGTRSKPDYVCGYSVNDPNGTTDMKDPIKIQSNMWNDSYTVVGNEDEEKKSGRLTD